MILSISTKREFIPKFNGNDKLPAADQIKIVHRAPTVAIKERLFPRKFEYNTSGELTGSFEVDRKKILKEFVTELVNISYKLDEDKETIKIKSVDELFNAPPEFDPLIDELYAYFQEILNKKVDEKN